MKSTILILVLGSLTGCIPCPHTAVWSPEISGRVLDSSTHAPIQGAWVSFMQSPQNVAFTDAAGEFRLRATRKFFLAYVPAEGDWPIKEKGPNYAVISQTNYYPFLFFDIINGPESSDSNGGKIGDILLNPKNPKSDICEIHHVQMVRKTVAIYYKMYPMDERSLELYYASSKLFPHAEEIDIPSYDLARPHGAEIYVCPECQKARDQWVLKYGSTH